MKTILYIHGMGGGEDSRIPSILNEWFGAHRPDVRVIVRTYDFNPDVAAGQIGGWYDELRPDLVIGESLGSVHALALRSRHEFPLLLVSPALNAPTRFRALRFLTMIPGVRPLLNRIYRPRKGERQTIDFTYANMRAWPPHRAAALAAAKLSGIHAFFGRRDHYRRTGIVSLKDWRRRFGPGTWTLYDGTHFMEEEYLKALLIPAILQRL
jgi:hypothetical protein